MSASASSQDWEGVANDKKDNPPPYTQEPIFEGFYVDRDDDLIWRRNCFPSDSIDGGIANLAYQHPPQNSQRPQHPQNTAYLQHLQQGQQYYDPPPEYYGPPTPLGNHTTGRQSAYSAPTTNNPWSVPATYPPGQCVIARPQIVGGQPPTNNVQPILEDHPYDYLAYSIFVTLCCCWIIGLMAVAKSTACRRAIAVGDRELAKEKSMQARTTANSSLAVGILMYIVVAVVIGIRVVPIIRY